LEVNVVHKLFLIGVLVAAAAFAAGCFGDLLGVKGSGEPASEKRQVAPFTEVKVSGAIDVKISSAPEVSCSVSGDDNIVPLVNTENDGPVLKVYTRQDVRPQIPLRVELTCPDLRRLKLSGACDAEVYGARGANLEIDVSGSGDVALVGIDVDRLEVEISGAGDVTSSGSADRVEFEVSGSGDGKMGALCTQDTQLRVSGAGGLEVAVARSLDARVSGAGSVKYLGDPVVERRVSGASSIQRIGPLPAKCAPPPAAPATLAAPADQVRPDRALEAAPQ
jgi:hypothetical protein